MGSSRLRIPLRYLYRFSNFTRFIIETVEPSLSHSYRPAINWLVISLHYHGQSYRGHSIVLIESQILFLGGFLLRATPLSFLSDTIIGQASFSILSFCVNCWKLCFW
uniref:Uncharacterized protein n=1 Tax=Placozoa sp. H2 TaxID=573895 RepID=A0A7I6N5M1_9METZ|nr:hypothetical protein [Placozoa sp. H2 HM-2017]